MDNNRLRTEKLLATRRWRKRHPIRARHNTYRNITNMFLKRYASNKELKDCKDLINRKIK